MLAIKGAYAPTILHVRRHRDVADHEVGARRYYRLLRIQEGVFTIHLDDETFRAGDGDVVLIPPGRSFQSTSHDRSRCQSISFIVMTADLESGESRALRLPPGGPSQPSPEAIWDCALPIIQPRPLADLVGDVISYVVETCWQGALQRLAGNHRLAYILERIVYHHHHHHQAPDPAPTELIDRVHGIVHEHFHSLRVAADIAGRLGISISQMNATYAAGTRGETPMAYLRRYRLNETARLLLDSDAKLNEIAMAVGFRNAQSLQQAWRQHYDMSPRQWRLAQRQA